ncbi:MAG: chemotaxis protein CheW [Bryobacterales bacterium]|nr:chemotaxis protein CheW [Bryobacterales bacterium]
MAEFVVKPSLIPLPSAQPWLPALLVWRGRSVPVLNLAWGVNGRGAAAAAETEDYLVLRTEGDESLVAVPVVGWPDSVDLPVEAAPELAPPVARADWFLAAFRRKHQLIFTPDFAAILRTQS